MNRGTGVRLAVAALVTLGAALVLRPFVLPASEAPLEEGPVVALGSAPGRVEVAAAIASRAEEPRPLLLSHPPEAEREPGGRCDDPDVRCVWPEPVSTWGEAQLIARLARDEAWRGVTVVTDDFHLARSRSLLRRCVDVPVRLVGTGTGGRVPVGLAGREALATLLGTVAYRDC